MTSQLPSAASSSTRPRSPRNRPPNNSPIALPDIANHLVQQGFSAPDAAIAAKGFLFQQFLHQVSMLAFMDCFRVIAWVTLAAVPLLFFVRRFTAAGEPSAAAHANRQPRRDPPTTNSFPTPVNTSHPVDVTSTVSSIRTPPPPLIHPLPSPW